jgi:hypothetical protein
MAWKLSSEAGSTPAVRFAAEGYIGAVRALQRMPLTQFKVLARLLFLFFQP